MTVIITLLASLAISCTPAMGISHRAYDDTPRQDSIIFKKEQMLAVSDSAYFFWFSDDIEMQSADPHAYWLMNRMMQSVQYVRTAEDAIAWTLALNEDVKEYGRRIDRRIYERRAEDAASLAIENLITLYEAGNQPELNIESYVLSILEHFRLINDYIRLMEFHREKAWIGLPYREYKEWFDLNNAMNGLMVFYTYAAAGYSALPMDINYTFSYWSEARRKELKIEKDIYWSYRWESYQSDARTISDRKFAKLISHFAGQSTESIIETIVSDWEEKDFEYARERFGERYDTMKIDEMVSMYETALHNWQSIREDIATFLPKEKQRSYRAITRQVNTRLYEDLKDLKEIRY